MEFFSLTTLPDNLSVIYEAPGDKKYVWSQAGHLPSYCSDYTAFTGMGAGQGRHYETNSVRLREMKTCKLFSCHDIFEVCKDVTDCTGCSSYSAFQCAFSIYALCAQVHAYKTAFNEAFFNAGIVICITYEILTGGVEMSKILCLYKAQETSPSTRSLN